MFINIINLILFFVTHYFQKLMNKYQNFPFFHRTLDEINNLFSRKRFSKILLQNYRSRFLKKKYIPYIFYVRSNKGNISNSAHLNYFWPFMAILKRFIFSIFTKIFNLLFFTSYLDFYAYFGRLIRIHLFLFLYNFKKYLNLF